MPAYNFKFSAEFFWTLFLFVLVSVATAFYTNSADVSGWSAHDWGVFGLAQIPVIGRAVAAFVITAITGNKLSDGFSA